MSDPAPEPDNQGLARETRVTRDGRKITYKVNVIQHPEKARACGHGAKYRRPVDPPPIMDLRIFEEDADGSEKDITYSYRANFFMWASLEPARPIAQGRVPPKEPTQGPELCGSPVSGISYLDRPTPAGYFIFPDLSIRHEGHYRLTFTLYEELRDLAMFDEDSPQDLAEKAFDHVNGRCIIKTKPFTVFSAKKFPGLSESTQLSRVVAEQGCRVRIRRDIRMRRRDVKDTKEHDYDDDDDADHEDEDIAPHHIPLPPSPDQKPVVLAGPSAPANDSAHQRNASVSTTAQYHPVHRHSASDVNVQYQPYPHQHPPPVPQPPHPQDQHQQHLQHQTMPPQPQPQQEQQHQQQQHYPPPPQHYDGHQMQQQPMPPQYPPPPQYIQHQQMPQPPQMQHYQQPPQYSYQQPPPQYYPYPPQYSYIPPPQVSQQPSPVYQPPPSHMRQHSLTYVASPNDYQPAPGQPQYAAHVQPTTGSSMTTMDNGSSRSSSLHTLPQHSIPAHGQLRPDTAVPLDGSNSLPPIQAQPHQTYEPSMGMGSTAQSLPYLTPAASAYSPTPSNAYQPAPPQYISGQPAGAPKPKRSFASTFSTTTMDQRLQDGARPELRNGLGHGHIASVEESNSDDDEPMLMAYKRADGTIAQRRWPELSG